MGGGCSSTSSVSPAEVKKEVTKAVAKEVAKEVKKIEKEVHKDQNEESKVTNKVERFNTASSHNASYKTVSTNADTDTVDDGSYRRPNYRITDALGYPSRLLVEPIRLILHYANQPYEEMAIPQDQFAYEDWGIRLPVLQLADSAPGEMFYGPVAIARYLAETYDLVSDDDDAWLCAQMDALVEIYEDMCKEILHIRRQPKYNQWRDVCDLSGYRSKYTKNGMSKDEAWQEFKSGKLTKLMTYISRTLKNNDTNWLVGKQVTWADLAVSDFFAFLVDKYDSNLLSDFPAIIKHIESIRAIPDIAEYISSRTELTK